MKILRNKTYQGMVDKVEKLIEEKGQLTKEKDELTEEREIHLRDLRTYEDVIHRLQVVIEESKEEKKKMLGAKGGYVKEINKLKKQVEELEYKLQESMTDKYRVKKIPSGRKPKSQPMKIKDCSRISNISRKVFSD